MLTSSLHIVPGLGKAQGGPAYSVPRLCQAIESLGACAQLLTVDAHNDPPFEMVNAEFTKQDFESTPILRSLRLSNHLKQSIKSALNRMEVCHSHGLWLMPNVYAGNAAREKNRPLVVTPRGMLSEQALEISKLKKRAFWQLLQKSAYARTNVWHATSEAEAEEIRRFGVTAPIGIIPNGVDTPSNYFLADQNTSKRTSNTVLFLSRLHPKKGLPNLIEAWAQVENTHPHWTLQIVGPDEVGEAARIKTLVNRYGLSSVSIEKPVFGNEKWRLLSEADVFVLPTKNENFGIAVAEALVAGTPAIVTKRAPWRGLQEKQCGWWIDYGVPPLVEALRNAMSLNDHDRTAMGRRGRRWIESEFGWDSIAARMLELYAWIVGSTALPSFLHE